MNSTFVLSHGGGETPGRSLLAEDLLCFFSLQQTSQTHASAPDWWRAFCMSSMLEWPRGAEGNENVNMCQFWVNPPVMTSSLNTPRLTHCNANLPYARKRERALSLAFPSLMISISLAVAKGLMLLLVVLDSLWICSVCVCVLFFS